MCPENSLSDSFSHILLARSTLEMPVMITGCIKLNYIVINIRFLTDECEPYFGALGG